MIAMRETRLRDLKGLGPKSEEVLLSIGIGSPKELKEVGALEAFIRMKKHGGINPSLNFLYAMIGALENRNWLDIARDERESILMSLDGFAELERELANEGIEI